MKPARFLGLTAAWTSGVLVLVLLTGLLFDGKSAGYNTHSTDEYGWSYSYYVQPQDLGPPTWWWVILVLLVFTAIASALGAVAIKDMESW